MPTKYVVTCAVKSVSGFQRFTVEAASEAEALAIFKRDGGEFLNEEIEVLDLDEPDEVGEYNEEEYGEES